MQTRPIAGALAALTALLLAGAAPAEEQKAPAAAGERKPWNQEAMTDLSGRLAKSMREIRSAFRKEPSYRDSGNPNRRASLQMEQTLRALEKSSTQLHNQVKRGEGYEETQGTARKIGMLLNDADEQGRKLMSSMWMDEKVKPAMELINQIAPYYGSGPLYDAKTMQRLDKPPRPGRQGTE